MGGMKSTPNANFFYYAGKRPLGFQKTLRVSLFILLLGSLLLSACQGPPKRPTAGQTLKALAAETFLADIAQNVAGERLQVEALLPAGLDPHAFEPTPQDVARVAASQVLIVNGAGFEAWLEKVLSNAGGERLVIEASAGLAQRAGSAEEGQANEEHEGDPHFWLNPLLTIHYVENIRDGLIQADPQGKATYTQNAADYIEKLKALDGWIEAQIQQIPAERRKLVTNHESFGYFADRYGLQVVGTLIPSSSSEAAASAQQLARLVDKIRQVQTTAIFLETGANPQLAEQIAKETGVKVVTDLYSHSITPPDGPAPNYLEMMRHNVRLIVDALQ